MKLHAGKPHLKRLFHLLRNPVTLWVQSGKADQAARIRLHLLREKSLMESTCFAVVATECTTKRSTPYWSPQSRRFSTVPSAAMEQP